MFELSIKARPSFLVWVGKEADDVIVIGRVVLPSYVCICRAASVLAELFNIGRVCPRMNRTVFLPYKYCISNIN